MARKHIILLCVFACFAFGVVFFSFQSAYAGSGKLKVAFLDIGQGDSIYIEAPNGHQMIIDGGPGTALMRALPSVMPYGDKTVDAIVITNPDQDHYSGFIPLLQKYDIGAIIEPGTHSTTEAYQTLKESITFENAPHLLAHRGMKVILDKEKNVFYEVLFPDRDVSTWESNNGSIVGNLIYGDTSVLLMGDATILTEGIVASENKDMLDSVDILKLGHHGSRTSTGEIILSATTPDVAIISAGLNNKYGHPHQEVLDRLSSFHIQYLETFKEGTILFESDGKALVRK